MMWLWILIWPLLVLSGGALVVWLAIAVRVRMMLASNPTIRRGTALPEPAGGWPALSVIVPAHNEEDMIDRCVESLQAQDYPALQVVFVCDRCTDETAANLKRHAAGDARLVVLENEHCPEDWAGKCHAAKLGAERATGDWLLFTDADTHFEPELCRSAVAVATTERLDLLSLLTTLAADRRFERLVQPVASMNLIQMYPPGRVNRAEGGRPFANGQFMLFERTRYEAVGGHESVKADLLEDIAISRVIARSGGRVDVLFADGMLTCAMYDSFDAFREGWKRIYIEACKRKPWRLRKSGLKTIALGALMPVVQIATLGAALGLWNYDRPLAIMAASFVLVGLGVQFLTLMRIYALSGAPRLASLGYPYGCLVVGRILLAAARDLARGRPIRWGGREYVLEVR